MLRENLKDAVEIIENILNQPLDIPGATPNVTLMQAIENYTSQEALESDLAKILKEFLLYPEPTQTLIQELELLSEDLEIK